jgi:hypothetical protein
VTTKDCESIREAAAGLAALPPDHPERAAAWEHARTCPVCARVVRESENLQVLLADVRPAPLPSAVLARVSGLVHELRSGDRRRIIWSALAACAVTLLLSVFARQRSAAVQDWILAALLCSTAAVLVVATRRFSLSVAAGAAGAAALAAGVSGRAGAIEVGQGLHCMALEIAAACAVVAAGWLAARRGLTSIGRGFIIGTAGAGALAADAALHLTCRALASLPHLLVFHLGGIILAAMLAGAAWQVAVRHEG